MVVAELSWVLTRMYEFSIVAARDALEWLFESSNIVVEAHDLVKSALALAAEVDGDISDAIIAAIANGRCVDHGDVRQAAAKYVPGMELLT